MAIVPTRPAGWDVQHGMDVSSRDAGAGGGSIASCQSEGAVGVLARRGDPSSLGRGHRREGAAALVPARPAGWDVQHGMDVSDRGAGAGGGSIASRQSDFAVGVLARRGNPCSLGRSHQRET